MNRITQLFASLDKRTQAALLAVVVAVASSLTTWTVSVQYGPEPGIVIILPDGDSLPISATATDPHADRKVIQAAEWVLAARLALNASIAVLERRSPNTPSERDDWLLAFLKTIRGDRQAFERAAAALQ
jgi:hypothetical protein